LEIVGQEYKEAFEGLYGWQQTFSLTGWSHTI